MVAPESVRRSGPMAYAVGLRTALAFGLLVFGAVDLAAIHTVLLPRYLATGWHGHGPKLLRGQPPPLSVAPPGPVPVARAASESPPAASPSAPSEPGPPAKTESLFPPAAVAARPAERAASVAPEPVAARAAVPEEPPETAATVAASAEKRDSFLLFIRNTAWLSPEARESLAALADRLKDDPSIEVVLAGHTDDLGTPEVNRTLSLRRAMRARAWLMERGVAEDRIEVRGLGSSQPAATGSTREARAQNRRVEITLRERSH